MFVERNGVVGTKNNPDEYDCYAGALPDEPMFVLLGRDPNAPWLIREWANERQIAVNLGTRPATDAAMAKQARRCADEMERWGVADDGAWR
jgi:hypothetical protein